MNTNRFIISQLDGLSIIDLTTGQIIAKAYNAMFAITVANALNAHMEAS